MLPVNKLVHFTITQIREEAPLVKSFVLKPDVPVSYNAGQFLTFVFHNNAGEEERRNYSIASSPVIDEPITITIKRVDNGTYSRMMVDKMQVGDTLQSIGASGFFVLPTHIASFQQLFFIAAGSGIVPVFSLIKTALQLYPHISIVLIYSNSSIETTIFYHELIELRKIFDGRLKIEFLFSNAKNLSRARLGIALLEQLVRQHASISMPHILFYLCGPYRFMQMATIELQRQGVPHENIKKEVFEIVKPKTKPLPPDTDAHRVTIQLAGKQYNFETQYPSTILQTAKILGINLPYSCESGQCGTCAATCISGKVWMWHNEVLMDNEIAQGRVLTCTGYAVGGNALLSYEL
ncbi:flavin reductase family protein [Parasediminibacterium sp. JCM 36343]|uniref:flavin reductase family protein n=1 Tax=Parasediminibacterium sp. JCM 36343 TaxID=3374279 RepID=UPI00397AC41F